MKPTPEQQAHVELHEKKRLETEATRKLAQVLLDLWTFQDKAKDIWTQLVAITGHPGLELPPPIPPSTVVVLEEAVGLLRDGNAITPDSETATALMRELNAAKGQP